MPKLIDWGVRYELIREAVVRVAAREGAAGVSLAAVAAELQVSASTLRRALDAPDVLPRMGADLISRLRRHRRYLRGCPPGAEHGSVEHIAWLLMAELPRDEEVLEQQRAWEQLTGTGADANCLRLRREDEDYLDTFVAAALERMGTVVASRPDQAVLLRAVLDGLVAALCRETVTPDQAVSCLEACLADLPREPGAGLSLAGA